MAAWRGIIDAKWKQPVTKAVRIRMYRKWTNAPRAHQEPAMLLRRLACLALIVSAPAQPEEGKKSALLVGVKAYDHFKLSPLKYTENDVTELALLLRPAGFDITLLTDSEGKKDKARKPTTENIR